MANLKLYRDGYPGMFDGAAEFDGDADFAIFTVPGSGEDAGDGEEVAAEEVDYIGMRLDLPDGTPVAVKFDPLMIMALANVMQALHPELNVHSSLYPAILA